MKRLRKNKHQPRWLQCLHTDNFVFLYICWLNCATLHCMTYKNIEINYLPACILLWEVDEKQLILLQLPYIESS